MDSSLADGLEGSLFLVVIQGPKRNLRFLDLWKGSNPSSLLCTEAWELEAPHPPPHPQLHRCSACQPQAQAHWHGHLTWHLRSFCLQLCSCAFFYTKFLEDGALVSGPHHNASYGVLHIWCSLVGLNYTVISSMFTDIRFELRPSWPRESFLIIGDV